MNWPVVLAQFLDLETSPTEPPPSAAEEAERTGESPWTAGRAVIPEASIGHAFFALDEVWFAVFGASVASPTYRVGSKSEEVEITLFFVSTDGCLPVLHDKTDHVYSLPQMALQDWVCKLARPDGRGA